MSIKTLDMHKHYMRTTTSNNNACNCYTVSYRRINHYLYSSTMVVPVQRKKKHELRNLAINLT